MLFEHKSVGNKNKRNYAKRFAKHWLGRKAMSKQAKTLTPQELRRVMDYIATRPHAARNRDFRKGRKLGKKDHIVTWIKPQKPEWMDQEDYDSYPSYIDVREVEVTHTQPGFKTIKRVLVTSFLNEKIIIKL